MKRYSCFYKNDFGDAYPALSELDDNGEWADFEEAAKEITDLRNDLTAARLERDIARNMLFRHACHCGRQGADPVPHAAWCPYRQGCLGQPTEHPSDNP